MAVARQYQQPRSIILGRVVKPGEPRWLPADREWALAYEEHLTGVCSGCHTPRKAWRGAKPGEAPFVGVVRECQGCEEKDLTLEEIPEEQRKHWQFVEMVPAGVYDAQQDLAEAEEMLRDWREELGLPRVATAAPVAVG